MTKEEFLLNLYEISGSDINYHFDGEEIIEKFEISEDEYRKLSSYWVDKGYLKGEAETTTIGYLSLFFNSHGIDYAEKLINESNQSKKEESMEENGIKIFVSHKSSDLELTKALVKLFKASLKISNEEIRCTSVPGFKFEPGINTNDAIRKEVNESSLLVCLLTPESLKSSFVLFELGARWGLKKPLIPLLAHGADYDDLPSPIRDKNAVKLEKEEDLYDLIEAISENLSIPTQKISSYRDEFNRVIDQALKKKTSLNNTTKSNKEASGNADIEDIIKEDASDILKKGEINGILRRKEGVEIAVNAGETFYAELQKACKENSYPESQIVFNVERKHTSQLCWDADLHGNGGSARIQFYIPATNRVRTGVQNSDDAHIRVYAANYNLFDSYSRISESEKKSYEIFYYLSLNEDKEPIWSEEKRADKGVSTKAILNKIFFRFYEFTKKHRQEF